MVQFPVDPPPRGATFVSDTRRNLLIGWSTGRYRYEASTSILFGHSVGLHVAQGTGQGLLSTRGALQCFPVASGTRQVLGISQGTLHSLPVALSVESRSP